MSTTSHELPEPSFVVREWTLEPADSFGAPHHIHHRSEEAFYVLEGELEVLMGAEPRRFKPGELAMVHRGTRHTFRAVGERPACVLAILTPELDYLITNLHRPGITDKEVEALWSGAHSEVV